MGGVGGVGSGVIFCFFVVWDEMEFMVVVVDSMLVFLEVDDCEFEVVDIDSCVLWW